MKLKFLVVLVLLCPIFIRAQTNTFPASGNVGIGSTTPMAKISFNDVDGLSDPSGITWYNGAPLNYGIYRTPGTWAGPAYQQLKLSWDTGIILEPGSAFQKSYVDIKGGGLVVSSGNVGIGIYNPIEKLSVNGKIRAKEVKVEATNWPDYVFDQDYQLLGLQELDAYIKAHKHLPDMPSATDAEQNGVELGEMNKLLLKKVEELTLHLIEKDKQLTESKTELDVQKVKLSEIEKKYNQLSELVSKLIKAQNHE